MFKLQWNHSFAAAQPYYMFTVEREVKWNMKLYVNRIITFDILILNTKLNTETYLAGEIFVFLARPLHCISLNYQDLPYSHFLKIFLIGNVYFVSIWHETKNVILSRHTCIFIRNEYETWKSSNLYHSCVLHINFLDACSSGFDCILIVASLLLNILFFFPHNLWLNSKMRNCKAASIHSLLAITLISDWNFVVRSWLPFFPGIDVVLWYVFILVGVHTMFLYTLHLYILYKFTPWLSWIFLVSFPL